MKPAALLVLAGMAAFAPAQEDPQVVFRSDVSLVRVDVQVLDRSNRAVSGLRAEDFVLREEGKQQQIRNFASEEMPVDVVFLIDVSGSMRPHVERLADASQRALSVMGPDDRVAIMVFDRATRTRSGFVAARQLRREMDLLLNQEQFNGGTDITRALMDAANYVSRNARREARRAIVILTDDRTEFERDEMRVGRALVNADAVLMALLAPDAMGGGYGYPRRGGGGGGGIGGWPGVILGPGYPGGGGGGRYPRGGGGYPGGGGGRFPGGGRAAGPQSAGTAEIARQSGGDSLPVDDASALETTLSRIRQRYALYFLVPDNARAGEERRIEVTLSAAARQRGADGEVRYRREYLAPAGAGGSTTTSTTSSNVDVLPSLDADAPSTSETPRLKRRPASDGSGSGPRGPNPQLSGSSDPATPADDAPPPTSQGGGWRRVKPGEKP